MRERQSSTLGLGHTVIRSRMLLARDGSSRRLEGGEGQGVSRFEGADQVLYKLVEMGQMNSERRLVVQRSSHGSRAQLLPQTGCASNEPD